MDSGFGLDDAQFYILQEQVSKSLNGELLKSCLFQAGIKKLA